METLILFGASAILVGVKSFQQLNVVNYLYKLILPTSLVFAVAEVTIILTIVDVGSFWVCIPIGFGGGLGAMISMFLHKKLMSGGK